MHITRSQPARFSGRRLKRCGPGSASGRAVSASPREQSLATCGGNRRRGSAAVEFAVVLPVLTTVILGMTDFGRLFYSAIAIDNAARAGAAYAIMNPSNGSAAWQTAVQQAAIDELSQSTAFDTTKLTVTASSVTESSGLLRVSVQTTYPYKTLINWSSIPSSFNLQHTVVMRGIR